MFSVSQIRFSVEYKKKGIIGDDQYVFRHDNTKERKNSLAQDIPKVLVFTLSWYKKLWQNC